MWDRLNWSAFEEFETRCLVPVYENTSFTIYRVREQAAALSAEANGR